eukprot:774823-Pyramimonas_sp.AAC.5
MGPAGLASAGLDFPRMLSLVVYTRRHCPLISGDFKAFGFGLTFSSVAHARSMAALSSSVAARPRLSPLIRVNTSAFSSARLEGVALADIGIDLVLDPFP